jgi:hypothetical protein
MVPGDQSNTFLYEKSMFWGFAIENDMGLWSGVTLETLVKIEKSDEES